MQGLNMCLRKLHFEMKTDVTGGLVDMEQICFLARLSLQLSEPFPPSTFWGKCTK